MQRALQKVLGTAVCTGAEGAQATAHLAAHACQALVPCRRGRQRECCPCCAS